MEPDLKGVPPAAPLSVGTWEGQEERATFRPLSGAPRVLQATPIVPSAGERHKYRGRRESGPKSKGGDARGYTAKRNVITSPSAT